MADASADRLAHRGPDGRGMLIQPGVGVLCHRRLAIMDPAHGHQPIRGRDSAAVVHNGEIYNFRALARELAAAGRDCHTGSDSEVIAHLYEEDGVDCLRRMIGMFALALYDTRDRKSVV